MARRSGCREPAPPGTCRTCWESGLSWAECLPRRTGSVERAWPYGLWKRSFGGDPGLLGRRIQLNDEAFEVIAVMPPDYRYPTRDFELWTPLYIPPDG